MPKMLKQKDATTEYSQLILGYHISDIKAISLQNGNEIFLFKKDIEAARKLKYTENPPVKRSIHLENSKIEKADKDVYVISRVKIVRTNGSSFYQEGFVLTAASIAWLCFYDPTNVLNLPLVEWSEKYDSLEEI